MNLNIDAQDILKAAERGVQLLKSDDVITPNSWNADLVCLALILQQVVDNNMEIKPVERVTGVNVVPKKVSGEGSAEIKRAEGGA